MKVIGTTGPAFGYRSCRINYPFLPLFAVERVRLTGWFVRDHKFKSVLFACALPSFKIDCYIFEMR
jgi:hypothetical protein